MRPDRHRWAGGPGTTAAAPIVHASRRRARRLDRGRRVSGGGGTWLRSSKRRAQTRHRVSCALTKPCASAADAGQHTANGALHEGGTCGPCAPTRLPRGHTWRLSRHLQPGQPISGLDCGAGGGGGLARRPADPGCPGQTTAGRRGTAGRFRPFQTRPSETRSAQCSEPAEAQVGPRTSTQPSKPSNEPSRSIPNWAKPAVDWPWTPCADLAKSPCHPRETCKATGQDALGFATEGDIEAQGRTGRRLPKPTDRPWRSAARARRRSSCTPPCARPTGLSMPIAWRPIGSGGGRRILPFASTWVTSQPAWPTTPRPKPTTVSYWNVSQRTRWR